jgi:hypothetical protein
VGVWWVGGGDGDGGCGLGWLEGGCHGEGKAAEREDDGREVFIVAAVCCGMLSWVV